MDQIERRVKLPAEASNLNEYARYYASDGNRVVGTFIELVDPENPYYDLPIGQRRWIENHRDLPAIFDGGCSVVNILFNPATQRVEQAFCNGLA